MSGTFTMRLRDAFVSTGGTWIIDESTGASKLDGGNIGLQWYTLFDPTYKDTLDGKIFDHYMNREIGTESIDMFQLAMRRKMNEIMPYYNQLYLSVQLQFDPLKTVQLNTISHGTGSSNQNTSGSGTSNNTNSAVSRVVSSDTPQTMLVDNEDYASGATDSNSQGTATGESSTTGTNTTSDTTDSDVSVSGYQGVSSMLVMQYRDSLINVDIQVINSLEELFMSVWDTGDTYFPHSRLAM